MDDWGGLLGEVAFKHNSSGERVKEKTFPGKGDAHAKTREQCPRL